MRAAIYARVSTAEQARKGTSIDTQLAKCRSYCDAREWVAAREYVDEGVSGTKNSRPAFDRLMADARDGLLDFVVVTRVHRFSRSSGYFGVAVAELSELGVEFMSVDESFDSSTAEGRLMRGILASFGEFDHAQISEKTMEGLEARAREGRWPGGPPPFGYEIVRDAADRYSTLEVHPDEAETVRIAADLILEGCSTLETVHRLNALGRRPPSARRRRDGEGMRWGHRGLATVLTSERLLGRMVWFQTSKTGREPIELEFDPVMDRDRWEALQQALGARSRPAGSPSRVYPLSGRIYGTCGQHYIGTYRKDRDRRDYRCTGATYHKSREACPDRWRPNADDLEAAVWGEVVAALSEPGRLEAMASDFAQAAPDGSPSDRLEEVATEVDRLEAALGDRLGALVRGGVDAGAVRVATRGLQQELEAGRRHLARLEAVAAQRREGHTRAERLRAFASGAGERLAGMDPAERKSMFALLDVRVQITDQDAREFRVEGVLPQAVVDAGGGSWQDSQA